jgi:hypothetical protein
MSCKLLHFTASMDLSLNFILSSRSPARGQSDISSSIHSQEGKFYSQSGILYFHRLKTYCPRTKSPCTPYAQHLQLMKYLQYSLQPFSPLQITGSSGRHLKRDQCEEIEDLDICQQTEHLCLKSGFSPFILLNPVRLDIARRRTWQWIVAFFALGYSLCT